jgi:hypothetical protein
MSIKHALADNSPHFIKLSRRYNTRRNRDKAVRHWWHRWNVKHAELIKNLKNL